jgi:N utilization substance protein A
MINTKELLGALNLLETDKGIAKETILVCLKEAIEKVYRKKLGDTDDALVRADIDSKNGTITVVQLKKVVEEVVDDFLEISLEDIQEQGLKLALGDLYEESRTSTDDFKKAEAMKVMAIFRQKLAEAEKAAMFELYKDKIGEMVVGSVEKTDDRNTILNIGRTSVFLRSSQKIPGETFKPGDRVKLYVQDVVSTSKGAQIAVSRADTGFLKRLFEEEIHEIYDGTVVIKVIAREAGLRSKVAVISNDSNVDPAGACIGQNGSRIQKIVGQLGNVKDKEKIDVIVYHDLPALFILESLKPAQVVGIIIDNEDTHMATAVIANGQSSIAIGRKGSNSRLAQKLTGWQIQIKELDEVLASGSTYQSADELRREEENLHRKKEQDAYIASIAPTPKDELPDLPSVESVPNRVVEEGSKPVAVQPVKPEPKPVVETVKTVVRTTKTLEELEKELEAQKNRPVQTKPVFNKKKPFKRRPQEEIKPNSNVGANQPSTLKPSSYMKIYTEEELKENETVTPAEPVATETEEIEDFDEYYEDEN